MHPKNTFNFLKLHPAQQQKHKYTADKTLLVHCNKSTHYATKIEFSSQKEKESQTMKRKKLKKNKDK